MKSKALISFAVFAYAKRWFSYAVVHIIISFGLLKFVMISNDISGCPQTRGHNKTVIDLCRFARKSVFGVLRDKAGCTTTKES